MRKEFVMTLSRPVLGLCIAALVGGCGGGDGVSPGPTGDRNTPIDVSPIGLSSGGNVAFAGTVHFSGGVCSGGYGRLFTTWSYGDNTPNGSSNVHTYGSPGAYTVRVTCTDASNNDKKYGFTTFAFTVIP